MKVAIIYTGMIRTMEKTLTFFKQNVLVNDNCHVFAVLQSEQIENDLSILQNTIKDNLKSIDWFDKNNTEWVLLQQHLLNKMQLQEGWKQYIGYNSGSMIEYYQMYLAYLKLQQYEITNNIKYNYVIRIRADCIITRPFQIHQNFEEDDVKDKINLIKLKYPIYNNEQILLVFMTSVMDDNRYKILAHRCCYKASIDYDHVINCLNDKDFTKQLTNYLNKGNYLITLRENVVYYGQRHVFKKISKLGMMYGKFKDHTNSYWFNAESQLKAICAFYDIDVYDSSTEQEVKSLYQYDDTNYYDDKGLKQNDSVLFFLQRV
jgi:hypothetical protein